MPDVSVIIPTYNRADKITRTIKTVLKQKDVSVEVLVCDDGSTDQTKTQIEKFKDRRVIWLPGRHYGLPAVARNRGLKRARGEWVAFLDSDDFWFTDKLSEQIAVMNDQRCLASCSNASRIIPGKPQEKTPLLSYTRSTVTFDDLVIRNEIICSSTIIHRSLLRKTGIFWEEKNLRAIEDYHLWLRIAVFTNFAYLASQLVGYTDDIAHSIRKYSLPDIWEQRGYVFGYFSKWAIKNRHIDRYLISGMHEYLRARSHYLVEKVRDWRA